MHIIFRNSFQHIIFDDGRTGNPIVPGECMSATQKSWRGPGSEATACHETKPRRAARRRKEGEDAI
jgi:hypothetical protein